MIAYWFALVASLLAGVALVPSCVDGADWERLHEVAARFARRLHDAFTYELPGRA